MKILIFNENNIFPLYRKEILQIVFFFSKFIVLKSPNKTTSIYFLNIDSIKKINFKFRGFYKATDSISMSSSNNFYIYFCFDYLLYKSSIFKKSVFKEFFFSFLHSILHNLDYNHELSYFDLKKQNILEKNIFSFFIIK